MKDEEFSFKAEVELCDGSLVEATIYALLNAEQQATEHCPGNPQYVDICAIDLGNGQLLYPEDLSKSEIEHLYQTAEGEL